MAGIGAGLLTSAPSSAYTAPNHYGHCGNAVDPIKTQNGLTIFPDTSSRGFDGISSVSIAATTASLSTPAVGQTAVTVTLCGKIPTFPFNTGTDGIDSGTNITICAAPNTAIATAPEYIGTGHRGGATYDGPYPPGQGYRACAFVGISVGNGKNSVIWAAGIFDPIESLTYFDQNSLHDLAGVDTICRPTADVGSVTTGFAGAQTITFCLPDSLVYDTGAAKTGPINNIDKLIVEPLFTPGSTVKSWSVTTEVSLEALTLPFAVCADTGQLGNGNGTPTLPAPVAGVLGTHSCDNPPTGCCDILNPITGVLSLNAITDSAPGVEWCTTPVTTCGIDGGSSWDYGILGYNYPAGTLTNPANGVALCALSWNYYAQENTDNWPSGIAGQGGWPNTCASGGVTSKTAAAGQYQDKGDACAVASSCAAVGTAVPDAGAYYSVYGRGPNPVVTSGYHLFAQYNDVPANTFVAG